MKIKLIFAWYDFWIGAFYDRKSGALYLFPIPMVGFLITWEGRYCDVCKKPKSKIDMASFYDCKEDDKKININ